jgi:hypothetical protein
MNPHHREGGSYSIAGVTTSCGIVLLSASETPCQCTRLGDLRGSPAPAGDPANLTAPLRRARLAGILPPLRERLAAVAPVTDPRIGLRHRRSDHLLGELNLEHRSHRPWCPRLRTGHRFPRTSNRCWSRRHPHARSHAPHTWGSQAMASPIPSLRSCVATSAADPAPVPGKHQARRRMPSRRPRCTIIT